MTVYYPEKTFVNCCVYGVLFGIVDCVKCIDTGEHGFSGFICYPVDSLESGSCKVLNGQRIKLNRVATAEMSFHAVIGLIES